MTEVLTVGAILLAWFVFRYDRHGRRRDAIETAYGTLEAVHYGMVQGLTPGQAVGWGQLYFQQDFSDAEAAARAAEAHGTVMQGGMDQVLVVPTEPLVRLATASPQEGLIDQTTVAIANFALWRVHVFNQLVEQLTDFNATHAAEITSEATDQARREELAAGATALSFALHKHGVGWAWSRRPGGGRGWFGTLVETLGGNMRDLETARDTQRWGWLRLREWPYSAIDVLVVAGAVAVVVSVVC